MGRKRSPIRRVADAVSLDHQTVRRALSLANIAESEIDTGFDDICATVRSLADDGKISGHGSLGRGDAGGADISELARVRAEHARVQIEKIRLQNEREAGKLINREAATESVTRLLGDLRSVLLAMGGKLASKLSAQTDVRSIAKIVEAEVRDTLTAFADEGLVAALDDAALS